MYFGEWLWTSQAKLPRNIGATGVDGVQPSSSPDDSSAHGHRVKQQALWEPSNVHAGSPR
jgi:hypothetical protein